MAELLLVNPRKRRRTTKKRASSTKRRRAAPRRRRRYRRNPAEKAPTRRHMRTAKSYAKNPRRRRRTSRRTGGRFMTRAQRMLMPSVQGAAGAMVLNMALAYLPLPMNLKSGPMGILTRGITSILIGVVGENFRVTRGWAGPMAQGALTVTMYNAMKTYIAPMLPMPVGEASAYEGDGMGYISPGAIVGGVGEYMESGDMGAYVSGGDLGAYVSGPGTESPMATEMSEYMEGEY